MLSLPAGHFTRKGLEIFIKKYTEAPLFIIGVDESNSESFKEVGESEYADMIKDFRPPYPTMLLDFPAGMNLFGRFMPYSESLVFIDTLGPDEYVFEELRLAGAAKESLYNVASPEERAFALSVPEYRRLLDAPPSTVVETSLVIIKIDRESGTAAQTYSKDFTYDCDVMCVEDKRVSVYTNFGNCRPPGGICRKKTKSCEVIENTANTLAGIVISNIAYINRPDRYIVRTTPELTDREVRQRAKGLKPSFGKKPAHIVLDHSQMKDIIAASGTGGTHASPLPHKRRGHWRNLRSDRYKTKKEMWIRPLDINKGLTVKVNKTVYEVIS
jgi:hypothetical protein